MTDDRYFYLFESQQPPSWGSDVKTVDAVTLGSGLTDMRFRGGGQLWEYSLNYDRKDCRPLTTVGQYLTPEFAELWKVPFRVVLSEGREKRRRFPAQIHDIYWSNTCICISGRVRDIIERIEPRRHQFIPARFVTSDTGEDLFADQEMHVLNVMNWIAPDQLFDLAAMPGLVTESGRDLFGEPTQFRISSNVPPSDYRIRPEWLDAGHLIITGDYAPRPSLWWRMRTRIFMSEALHAALKENLPSVRDTRISIAEPGPYWKLVLRQKAEQPQ